MADARAFAGDRPEDHHPGFAVASTAISMGVRRQHCGRLHLPARLTPLAIRSHARRRTEVELRCVRCHRVASLLLDQHDPDHRTLLTQWREQRAGGDSVGGDTKDPR